ncbi:hypothetical protein HO133_009162 [Letharia lupina]|uniref:Uncharacterized protein n=1 Tax=Letharia lupina TaxID=560253 RepID=A0A8H6FFK3_9LECA|nr:uncharacterized protein HO133_009162 [Letharia lupina]KAF6226296.1 hypothetical protein HO133_009162 [Letharia lupina]
MKQEINGLQRGLRQLQLEIDREEEEFKEIVIKINTTREGPHRKLLRELGDSTTVVQMSLHDLNEALETMSELETDFSPEVGLSLPMYYAFYYQPLFRRFGPLNLDPEVYSRTEMNGWIH